MQQEMHQEGEETVGCGVDQSACPPPALPHLALSSALKRRYFLPSHPGFHRDNPKWINIHYMFHGGSVIKGCFLLVFLSAHFKRKGAHFSKVRTDLNRPP